MEAWDGCASYGLQGVSGLKVIGPKVFTPEVMAQMAESLAEAERLSAGDELSAKRVEMARRMYAEAEEALAAIGSE